MKKQQQNFLNKGEASIVFTFVILMIVLMGAFTISIISIGTIKSAKTGENSALALYAADTGIEQATSEYWWAGGDAGAGACVSNNQTFPVTLVGSTALSSYELVVDDEGDGTGACPTVDEINNDTGVGKKLCIEAIGKSGNTERKLSNELGLNNDPTAVCVFK